MSSHVDGAKLKSLMLNQVQLTEGEENHLRHCPECMNTMVKSTLEELGSEKTSPPKSE